MENLDWITWSPWNAELFEQPGTGNLESVPLKRDSTLALVCTTHLPVSGRFDLFETFFFFAVKTKYTDRLIII